MRISRSVTLFVTCLLSPSVAFADGGGPLLLIINGMAFLYGGVIIIVVEWLLYIRLAKIAKLRAFTDALITNLVSTALVGFGVPLLVAAIPLLVHSISKAVNITVPDVVYSYAFALGTWVMRGIPFPKLTVTSAILWWILTFFLTVYVEKKVLGGLWRHRQFNAAISARALSWKSNIATYLGLIVVIMGVIVLQNYGSRAANP